MSECLRECVCTRVLVGSLSELPKRSALETEFLSGFNLFKLCYAPCVVDYEHRRSEYTIPGFLIQHFTAGWKGDRSCNRKGR